MENGEEHLTQVISIVGALFQLIFWLLVIAMIWFFFSKVLPKIKEYRQIWFGRFPRFNQALVVLTILIAVMVVAFNVWFWMMTNSFFEAFTGIFKGLLDTLFLFVLSAFFIPLGGGYYLQRKELKTLSQQPVYEEPEPVMERHTGDEDEKEQPQTLKVEPDPQAFEHLIDMEPAINVLKESLEFPIHHPELMEKYRIKPPTGLLLYGPPGTGKTTLARAASKYFGCSFFPVKAGELLSSAVGSSEEKLREVFDQAKSNRPSIIFFDEIDSIATKRDGSNMNRPSDVLLTPLLTELDGFDGREGVFVMAATNRLDVLDEAVLRPGRFDRHIKVDLPGLEGRKKLIRHFLFGRPVKDVDVDHWAQVFERKSPAWMEGIIDQAVIEAAKREGQGFKATGITNEDIRKACPDLVDNFVKKESNPQAFDRLIGMERPIEVLKEALEFPIKHPKLMDKFKIKPPAGLLLYGPPGTGKTALARAAAEYFGCAFFPVKAGELLEKWVGSSQENLRNLFKKARENKPSIIFFDEIDSIAMRREGGIESSNDQLLTPLLTELDGFEGREGVFVIAATNRKDTLDEAVIRPGRFDRHVEVSLPDLEGRKKLIRHFLKGRPVDRVDIDYLAEIFEERSPAWIQGIIDQAVIDVAKEEGRRGIEVKLTNQDIERIVRMQDQTET